MQLTLLTCPMISEPCRHCSEEFYPLPPHSTLTKDFKTGFFKKGRNGITKRSLGFFCNDAGKFIEKMHYCPVRCAMIIYPVTVVPKKKARGLNKRKR